jgi:hypothetical protein
MNDQGGWNQQRNRPGFGGGWRMSRAVASAWSGEARHNLLAAWGPIMGSAG